MSRSHVLVVEDEPEIAELNRLNVEREGFKAGIASEHHNRIFERFYRFDSGRGRDIGETGLGLAIDKHIAPVHGGRMEVQPQMGEGSTFTLPLPARVEGTSIGADPANPFHAFLAQHSSFESCQQDR